MLSNAERDELIASMNDLADRVDLIIRDFKNPGNPNSNNTAIQDLLPMLDFYNGDLRSSAENLKKLDFDGEQRQSI